MKIVCKKKRDLEEREMNFVSFCNPRSCQQSECGSSANIKDYPTPKHPPLSIKSYQAFSHVLQLLSY